MPTLQYPNNPNTDTAFVVQDDGTKNRALMTAPQDTSTLELPSNPNSTKGYVTIDGKKQRVVLTADISGAGGDQHNLGWYATESALTTAHPTATDGDWAIIGSTDTVWVWDTDTTAWKDTGAAGIELPSQTGNAGKFLTTNGTSPSWGTSTDQTIYLTDGQVEIRQNTNALAPGIDIYTKNSINQIVNTLKINNSGLSPSANNIYACGSRTYKWANVYTTKINNGQDISIPNKTGSLVLCIYTLPTADLAYKEMIYQYTGPTDSTYTNGHFYKCVSDGQTPATYSWEEISMGGSSLPSQTGNSGKFLTTNGTSASWATINALQNTATGTNALTILGTATTNTRAINIGAGSSVTANDGVAIGAGATAALAAIAIGRAASAGITSIAIGWDSKATANYAIQLGYQKTNSDANTMKVGNANGNFEIMSADGTIPTDRFTTTPSADGTYVPTLTISSGVATRSWSAPSGGGSTGTTASLVVANWSSNTQTVNVTGVTASNNVIVAPAPASQADYTAAGIICTAQGANSLTFTATTTPTSAITVNVLII